MGNVMSMLKLKNKPSRNGFDLSRKNAFTAKAGELLPCFCEHVMPTDHFKIRINSFTRTQPLQTAAFTRLREYYDFYFVPYRLLWRFAPTFFTQMNEKQFAENMDGSQSFPSLLPHCTLQSLYTACTDTTVSGNDFSYDPVPLRFKLAQYLDYGLQQGVSLSSYAQSVNVNLFPLAAYQKIYYDYFRDSQWEQNNPLCYNFDYVNYDSVVDVQKLMNLSPNNQYADDNLLTLRYANYPVDYFQGLLPSPQYGDVAAVSSNLTFPSYLSGSITHPSASSVTGDDNYAFFQAGKMYMGRDLEIISSAFNPGETQDVSGVNFYLDSKTLSKLSSVGEFSIAALRQAEALQRWREISQPNAKDYPSQMRAHFGSNTPDVLGNFCTYIGGMSSNISINDVTNTSLDESSDTVSSEKRAWIKGKGTFVTDGSIDFTAQEHGIIMGIYHVIPLLDYDSVGVSAFNSKTAADDFAIPEFDKIGMQSVDCLQLSAYLNLTNNDIKYLGYSPRYAEYKTSVDKVHGAFVSTLKDWYSPITSEYINGILTGVSSTTIKNWFVFKKVCPGVLDTIFGVNADGTADTDCFLVNSFMDVKAVRPLDRNGLPY